jgi:hypothetical protein
MLHFPKILILLCQRPQQIGLLLKQVMNNLQKGRIPVERYYSLFPFAYALANEIMHIFHREAFSKFILYRNTEQFNRRGNGNLPKNIY